MKEALEDSIVEDFTKEVVRVAWELKQPIEYVLGLPPWTFRTISRSIAWIYEKMNGGGSSDRNITMR